ncbi:YdbL family protein [Robiginitomaculum antarcticum]|uniref:YdbL family protein n=1 Tax=Robiginitomaculum antarcticum TaxID=437507 RepID=UPI000366449F|nr:YdbL family protein [Robiginitomaculum antarcticum]
MAQMKTLIMSVLGGAALIGGVVAGTTLLPDMLVASAQAQTADDLKDQGKIGETAEGYLAAVTTLTSSEQAAMDEINAKRKTVYTRLAREQGVSVSDVAKLTAEKLVAKAPSGHMIRDGFGAWVPKP